MQVVCECGLHTVPGEPGCDAWRDELLARDFQQPAFSWRFHRLAVDAYCLQHSAYVASAKSLAAHLCGLCVALEHGNDADKLRTLQQWLSTNPKIQKPELPRFKGQVTIADVYGIEDPVEFGRAVEAWARSTWEAYSDLHGIAWQWLSSAIPGDCVRTPPRRRS